MENLPTGSEILKKIIETLGITIYELANKCGYERVQALYDVSNGKTQKISTEMAKKIISAFPDIRLEFLIYGEEPVLKSHIEENGMISISIDEYNDLVFHKSEMKRYRGLFENQVRTNSVLINVMDQLNKSSRKQSGGSASEQTAKTA